MTATRGSLIRLIHLINSFATTAHHIMTGVKRLDKLHNTAILATVSRQHLTHSPGSTTELLQTLDSVKKLNISSLPTTIWQHSTRAILPKLYPLHPQADRTWNGWTVGVDM